jgi:hypothetical protein
MRSVPEVAAVLAVAAVIGWIRPRWSSLAVTAIPIGLALAWLFLHEDVPSDETTLSDVAWYLGMSFLVAAPFAVACAVGIVARKAARRDESPTPL